MSSRTLDPYGDAPYRMRGNHSSAPDVAPKRPPTHSGVPPTKERAFDPDRLRRGALRAVEKLGAHQYRVEGRHERFYDVNLDLDVPCTCKDAEFHGRGCLHELAARLHDGDGPLIQSLGDLLLRAENNLKEHTRRTRRRKESAA